MDKTTTSGPVKGNGEIGNDASSSQNPETCKHQSLPSTSPATEKTVCARKNYKRAANRGRKCSQVLAGRKYSLSSSHSNVRVLRYMSTAENSPSESVHTPVQQAGKRTTRGRPAKTRTKNEFSKIRQQVRYILNRMNYEQSLIEAYASEGWKRQSLERIRPEKELEPAKAEILWCKLRIREAFQNLDYLLSKGKHEESLFDSEGEISSEDVCQHVFSDVVYSSLIIVFCYA